MTKVRIDLLNSARLDFEPSGVFVRSHVHDRRGDPHLSFHWEPRNGEAENTPHLTRRSQERVWLPTFPQDKMHAFFERTCIAMVISWASRVEPLDLHQAQQDGWRITVTPPSMEEHVTTQGERLTVDLSIEFMACIVEHMTHAAVAPIELEGWVPPTSPQVFGATRWVGGRIVEFRNVLYLSDGLWVPGEDGPTQVGDIGWYFAPRDGLDLGQLERLAFGENRAAFEAARRQIDEFFGEPTSDIYSTARRLEKRLLEIIERA